MVLFFAFRYPTIGTTTTIGSNVSSKNHTSTSSSSASACGSLSFPNPPGLGLSRINNTNHQNPLAPSHTPGQTSSSDLLEDELNQTSAALGGAQTELRATQIELRNTAGRLQAKEVELTENCMNLSEAYKALEKAQQELSKMT